MSAPPAYHNLGAAFALLREDITVSVDDFDRGQLEYLCPTRTYIKDGQVAPGFPGLIVQRARASQRAGDYFITCDCAGLLMESSKIISTDRQLTPHDFDQVTIREIVAAGTGFVWGSGVEGCNTTSASEKQLDSHWLIRTRVAQGISSHKLRQRVITVNENIVSPSVPVRVLLPGGWRDYRKGRISMPRVVVTDTYVDHNLPPTGAIPGNLTPPNAPPVQVIVNSGSDFVYNYPANWKLSNISYQRLLEGYTPGKHSLSYEFVFPTDFA